MRLSAILLLASLPLGAQIFSDEPSALDGSTATVAEGCPVPGSTCVRLDADPASRNPVLLIRTLDAAELQGKEVRYRAALRIGARSMGQANLFVRVDRPGGVGFQEYSFQNAVRALDWQSREIVGRVDDDAEQVTIGVRFQGVGSAYVADATFTVDEQ